VVIVVPACRRELDGLPLEVRGDLADALARLDAGLVLAMPCRVRCRVSAEESMSSGSGIVQVTTA
jgi:hypothetical protein